MKKTILAITLCSVILFGACKKETPAAPAPVTEATPVACVTTTTTNVNVGISFIASNCSTDASSCQWEDGDGTITQVSGAPSRSIVYNAAGIYTIKLTAYSASKAKSSMATVVMIAK